MKKLSEHPIAIFVGLLSSVIGIFVFATGIENIRSVFGGKTADSTKANIEQRADPNRSGGKDRIALDDGAVTSYDTVGQYARYTSMITIIDELLPISSKGYEILNEHIRKPGDCNKVAKAVNVNRIVGSALKVLVKKFHEDQMLINESHFNVRPLKDFILEIDQWNEDYGRLGSDQKLPCKMPMFAPMGYLMLRDDLIQLKGELREKLNASNT